MNKIAVICDKLLQGALYLLVFALPLFFLPWTFETLEFNKQNFLVVLTLIAGLAWLGKIIAGRQIALRRSFLNLIVLLYLLAHAFSTIFSVDKFRSFLGASGVEKDGFITVLCFVLLYFIIINNVREIKIFKNLIYSILLGAGLAAIFALLGFVGLLPDKMLPSRAFNTVGALSGFGIFLAAVFVLTSAIFLKSEAEAEKKSLLPKILFAILAVLILFLLISIDTWMVWTAFAPALALFLAFIVLRAQEIKNLSWVALPMIALVAAILFFFIRTPLNFNLPAEVMPSFSSSGQITKQTLEEAPLLGTGPGTFAFNYSKYKPEGVNLTPLWNVQFDRSASRLLTMLATTGLFGLISWLFIVVVLAARSLTNLTKGKVNQLWMYNLGLASSWFLLLLAKFLYSSNLTLEFLFWILTALLVTSVSHKFWETPLDRAPRASLLLSFILTLGIIFSVSSFYLVGQRYAADANFRRAALAAESGEEMEKVVGYFNRAAAQNRWNDTYLRNLAQGLLAQINQELNLPPSDERARKIQNLITADINVAKRATELSPKNSANWATLALIYGTIMPIIPGADQWTITSWEKAIELEPGNPYFYTEFGKVYTNLTDLLAPNLQAEDEAVKKDAQDKIKDYLAKAEERFNKAISLKGDYAPSHFELAMVYSRQGKIKEAISKLEIIKANLPNDIGVAFQLGLLYYQNKEQDKAVAELERVIELAPNFANARWYLAAIYEEQGKKDLAIVQLDEILKTNPENEIVKKKIDDLKTPPSKTPLEMPEPLPEEPGGE
jgi:tetratricopeptide (TPR) repeat protein